MSAVFDGFPIWGETTISGILLAIIVWMLWKIASGGWVPKGTVDKLLEVSKSYEDAWKTERERTEQVFVLMDRLTVVGENMEKVLNALPVAPDGGDSE